jgi:hypothetical protein
VVKKSSWWYETLSLAVVGIPQKCHANRNSCEKILGLISAARSCTLEIYGGVKFPVKTLLWNDFQWKKYGQPGQDGQGRTAKKDS